MLTVAFVGPAGVGKSSLAGQCLVATGKTSALELRRVRDEARELGGIEPLALLLDSSEEEKKARRSLEIGRALLPLEGRNVLVFDCPGDSALVPTTARGIAQADAVVLVLDAGAVPDAKLEAQLRELLRLARLVPTQSLLLALNKIDAGEGDMRRWVTELAMECGWRDVACLAVSALTGANVHFSTQPSLLSWLRDLPLPPRGEAEVLRAPVFERSAAEGLQLAVLRLVSGALHTSDDLLALPSGTTCRVNRLFAADGATVSEAAAGECVLAEIVGPLAAGEVLVRAEQPIPVCKEFEAEVEVVGDSNSDLLSAGFSAILHLHALQVPVCVLKVLGRQDSSSTLHPAAVLRSGERGLLRLQTYTPICAERSTLSPSLSTLLLRRGGATLAFGRITRLKPLATR